MAVGLRDVVAAGAGAAFGLASGDLTRRVGPRRAVVGGAIGLVIAAAIYPAARRSFGTGGVAAEVATVAATAGLGLAASRLDSAAGRQLVAAGWASHALFDAVQGPSDDSRLPGWYPALCAGYDIAYAARLAAN